MTRAYRLLHSPKPLDRLKGRIGRVLSDDVKFDMQIIRGLFENTPGSVFIDDFADFKPSSACHVGFTDACRELKEGSYSGMGGWDVLMGRYWWYQLSEEEQQLPIHITEQIAQLCQLRLNTEELRGSSYVEFVDNAAVVAVSRSGGAKDQRIGWPSCYSSARPSCSSMTSRCRRGG